MRVLWWAAVLVIAVAAALFTVANRGTVSLGLWPLPDVVELPLFLVVFAALLIGFLAGEIAAWIGARRRRREARRSARRIAALEREIDAVRGERVASPPPADLAG